MFLMAGGGREHVFLLWPRVRVVAGFHRLNSDEALGLHSALFLSAERFHALILSFPPAWFPWKCRPLGNAKPCTSCTGSVCYFWSQLSSECIPKCQREQVLVGASGDADGRFNTQLSYCGKNFTSSMVTGHPSLYKKCKIYLGKH